METLGTRDVYGEVLLEMGTSNPDIVALDARPFGVDHDKGIRESLPGSLFQYGCIRTGYDRHCGGAGPGGKIPFVSTFAIFATGRVWEQVRQAVAYPRLNVKIVASHGGLCVGEDGASHQALEAYSLMRVIPHMTVIVPADGVELKGILKTALETPGPFYIRTSRMKFPVVQKRGILTVRSGTSLRDGRDLTIIACGLMVSSLSRPPPSCRRREFPRGL